MTDLPVSAAIDRMVHALMVAVRAAVHGRPETETDQVAAALVGFAIGICDVHKVDARALFDRISPPSTPARKPYEKPSLRVVGVGEGMSAFRAHVSALRPPTNLARPELDPAAFCELVTQSARSIQETLIHTASRKDERGASYEDNTIRLISIVVRETSDGVTHAVLDLVNMPKKLAERALRVALEKLPGVAVTRGDREGMH